MLANVVGCVMAVQQLHCCQYFDSFFKESEEQRTATEKDNEAAVANIREILLEKCNNDVRKPKITGLKTYPIH